MTLNWSTDALQRVLADAMEPSSDYELNAVAPPATPLRQAGVLAAFHETDGRLVLTKRASGLRHHPGQIALPGGKVDPTDEDVIAAALREAHEEIGLSAKQVEILGTLPAHQTVTGFAITPVIGVLRGGFSPLIEPGEVDEAFTLPFSHVSEVSNYRVERRRWREGWRSYYAAPYGPYYLWGATARILLGLARRL